MSTGMSPPFDYPPQYAEIQEPKNVFEGAQGLYMFTSPCYGSHVIVTGRPLENPKVQTYILQQLSEQLRVIYTGHKPPSVKLIDQNFLKKQKEKRGSMKNKSEPVPDMMPAIRIIKENTTVQDNVKKIIERGFNLSAFGIEGGESTQSGSQTEVGSESPIPSSADSIQESKQLVLTEPEVDVTPIPVSVPVSVPLPVVEPEVVPVFPEPKAVSIPSSTTPSTTLNSVLSNPGSTIGAWASLSESSKDRKASSLSERMSERTSPPGMDSKLPSSQRARALSTPKPIKKRSKKSKEPEPEEEELDESSHSEPETEDEPSHSESETNHSGSEYDSDSEEQSDSATDESEEEHIREESKRRRQERRKRGPPIEIDGEIDSSVEDITTLSRRMRYQRGVAKETVEEVWLLKRDMKDMISSVDDIHKEVYDLLGRVNQLAEYVQDLTSLLYEAGVLSHPDTKQKEKEETQKKSAHKTSSSGSKSSSSSRSTRSQRQPEGRSGKHRR